MNTNDKSNLLNCVCAKSQPQSLMGKFCLTTTASSDVMRTHIHTYVHKPATEGSPHGRSGRSHRRKETVNWLVNAVIDSINILERTTVSWLPGYEAADQSLRIAMQAIGIT